MKLGQEFGWSEDGNPKAWIEKKRGCGVQNEETDARRQSMSKKGCCEGDNGVHSGLSVFLLRCELLFD